MSNSVVTCNCRTHMAKVVASVVFSQFRALFMFWLANSGLLWWFIYYFVVFAAVERNILKCFGNVLGGFGGVF